MESIRDTSSIGTGVCSMTGFGRSEQKASGRQISVEIRSVNNRFIEIGMKIPRELNPMEGDIRERLRTRLARGRVSVLISFIRDSLDESPLHLDVQAAQTCFLKLQELNKALGCNASVTLGQLLHFSDYFTQDVGKNLEEALRQQVLAAIDAAVEDLVQMRRLEGISLALDLLARLGSTEQILGQIETLAKDQPQVQMQKLRERLQLLSTDATLDEGRLETEMTLMADRLDISEECVRMRSHCQLFREALAGNEPPGKRLGFLLQEMNREVNTISSKSALAELTHLAVGIKEEIERMREQIQNLE